MWTFCGAWEAKTAEIALSVAKARFGCSLKKKKGIKKKRRKGHEASGKAWRMKDAFHARAMRMRTSDDRIDSGKGNQIILL